MFVLSIEVNNYYSIEVYYLVEDKSDRADFAILGDFGSIFSASQ